MQTLKYLIRQQYVVWFKGEEHEDSMWLSVRDGETGNPYWAFRITQAKEFDTKEEAEEMIKLFGGELYPSYSSK